MTTKDFRNLVITETKKILINEDISGELEQSNRSQGNHLQGNDEIGEFNIVVHPIEGNVIEDIVKKVSIPHLLQKVKNGEIQIENIHSICKKDTSATTKGKKLLKEFNSSLQSGRKAQLEQMQTKRKGYQLHLDGYKLSSKDRELDEAKNMQLKKLEELISRFDNQIAELQKKINENKKPINESLTKKDQLRELFGFGSSAETKGMTPEEKKQYETDKSVAKHYMDLGDGDRIGQMLNYDKKWLKVFEPFFPKMSAYIAYRVLRTAPKFVGWFYDNIKYKKLFDTDRLSMLANEHSELDNVFTEMGLNYNKPNKKEKMDELFGFGKKKDPEQVAREKHEDDMKHFAKVVCKGNRGKEIGQHLATNIDDIKYFTPYIQKMSSEDIKDILMECPKVIMFFNNVLDKIGSYYAYFLVQKHPFLAKVFDQAGLSYGKVNKKSDELTELFGFGKKTEDTSGMTPEQIDRDRQLKVYAKSTFTHGASGTEIGRYLKEEPDDIKYWVQYIPKMRGRVMCDILHEAPNTIGYFKDYLKNMSIQNLSDLVLKHSYLKHLFDKMGVKYNHY